MRMSDGNVAVCVPGFHPLQMLRLWWYGRKMYVSNIDPHTLAREIKAQNPELTVRLNGKPIT